MPVIGGLQANTLVRHIRKHIPQLTGQVKLIGVYLRAPVVCGKLIGIRIKIKLTRLLFIPHVTGINKAYPSFFYIIVLPAVHYIYLLSQGIIKKTVIIHIVFTKSPISVYKKAGAPLI